MNKADRNDRIIAALRQHGTLKGAAQEVGVDPGTVRRLIARSPDASEAWLDGQLALRMQTVERNAARVTVAYGAFRRSEQRLERERRALAAAYDRLSAEQVREAEKGLEHHVEARRNTLAQLKLRDRQHARSIRRYQVAVAGMSA